MADFRENCIEWLNGQDEISVTLSQGRHINKVERLAKKFPDLVKILNRNPDGSIFAKLPLKALKLNIVEVNISDEKKNELRERAKKMVEVKNGQISV